MRTRRARRDRGRDRPARRDRRAPRSPRAPLDDRRPRSGSTSSHVRRLAGPIAADSGPRAALVDSLPCPTCPTPAIASPGWPSTTARRARSTACRSTSRRARCSGCSARTARARPRPSRSLEGYRTPDAGTRARARARPGPRRRAAAAAHRRHAARGRPLPGPEAARAAAAVRGLLRRPRGPRRAARHSSACATRSRTPGAAPLGRPGAAAVARVRARSAGPRSCSSTSRPRAWTRTPARRRGSSSATCATRGVTVLLTTHAMDEAEQLCDRVAIIAGGKLAALGSPAELTRHAVADEIWFAAAPGLDSSRSPQALGLDPADVRRGTARASTSCAPPARRRASPTSRASSATTTSRSPRCRSGRRSLEEVFLQITAEERT